MADTLLANVNEKKLASSTLGMLDFIQGCTSAEQ
jgi:hypothetical protein